MVLTQTNIFFIQILNLKEMVERQIDIVKIKSISVIEDSYDWELILHVKDEISYQIMCGSREHQQKLIEAVKHIYWLKLQINIPVYVIPFFYRDKVWKPAFKMHHTQKTFNIPIKFKADFIDRYPDYPPNAHSLQAENSQE